MTALLTLPGELTIYTAGELHSQWLAWLHEDDAAAGAPEQTGGADAAECLLDGSSVAEIDTAGMQLLLSLRKSLLGRGVTLKLRDASPALASACAGLGLSSLLADAGPDEQAAPPHVPDQGESA